MQGPFNIAFMANSKPSASVRPTASTRTVIYKPAKQSSKKKTERSIIVYQIKQSDFAV